MTKIKYTKSVTRRPTYRTCKYSNLLSDTWQGEVLLDSDNEWQGWLVNFSNPRLTEFEFGFKSKRGATRWVNKQLRELGI